MTSDVVIISSYEAEVAAATIRAYRSALAASIKLTLAVMQDDNDDNRDVLSRLWKRIDMYEARLSALTCMTPDALGFVRWCAAKYENTWESIRRGSERAEARKAR